MTGNVPQDENRDNGAPEPGIKRVVTDQGNKAQRLLRVDQIYSRKDRQVHFVKTAKTTPRPDRFGKTAMVVRRIISVKGLVADTEIDIKSPHLERLLKAMFEAIPDLKLNESPPIASRALLFFAAPKLLEVKEQEKLKAQPDQSLINDIGTVLRFVEEDFGGATSSLQSLLAAGEITYDLLWAIFPPSELVVAMEHGLLRQPQAMSVLTTDYVVPQTKPKYFTASGMVITHDGEDFGKAYFELMIPIFEGARKLSTLSFLPMRFHPEEDKLRDCLIARGKKYIYFLQGPACREYTIKHAVAEDTLIAKRTERNPEKISAKGRVMVDPISFWVHNSDSNLNRPAVYAWDTMSMDRLSDANHLILGAMDDIQWNHQAFQKLVIEEDRRTLIHALVKAHRNDNTTFDDIIANKGQGLVGLLSGSPGVGKTLTAEAVAEVTERPLYMISAGELGISADTVDVRLGVILDITRRWGCVLLIDEADVFLGMRGNSLQRDSLVSVFLRRLEYFMGVCILTTNRKQEIDPAFQSRIHFTLQYPDLNTASRKAVWTNFLATVGRSSETDHIGEAEIDELAKHVLNGRQIKNIVSCTVSLSRESKQPITTKRIQQIVAMLTT